MNYFNPEKNIVYTEETMSHMGLPINDEKTLVYLGYYPIVYNYPEYDSLVDKIVPVNDLVKVGDRYIQNFVIASLSEESLKSKLDSYEKERLDDASKAADNAVLPYISEFSEVERQTWIRQQDEVAAYLQDNTAPTPTLDAIASARGITRELMIEKTVNKVAQFEPVKLKIIGIQQSYRDQIQNIAKDENKSYRERIKDLQSLVFDYQS